MEVLYTSILHETLVLGRDGLRDEGQDCLDADVFDEAVVLLLWIAAAIDATRKNSPVVGGRDERLQAFGT